MAKAAAVFDHFADHGNPRMLGWEAFPTAVRGCGFDPTEKQLADIWKNVTATSDDKAEGNRITYQQFSAALQSAPGLADVDSALALLIGPRSLTPAEAKTLLTTAGDEPLSDAEWNAFEDLVFPDGAARTSSDILAVFREEDPASRSFAPRFNPRPPDPDLETGAPPADKGLAAEVEETGKDSTYVYTAPKGGDVLASAESNMHKSVTLAERGTSLSTHAEARNLSNELFKLVDKDNSGKISPSEFDTLKSIVAEVSADFIPENISELDRNADKEVDEGEWTKHMDAAMRSMGPQKFVDTCFSTLSRTLSDYGIQAAARPRSVLRRRGGLQIQVRRRPLTEDRRLLVRGKTFTLDVAASDSVASVKAQIHAKEELSVPLARAPRLLVPWARSRNLWHHLAK